ncbi:MAG: GTP-binding protein [Nitrososphaera sp.]
MSKPSQDSANVAAAVTKQVPVTIVTGFLGSGKTTLLNHILTKNHGKRVAIIENEFGEIGIDNELIIGADEEIFEMSNGCICCTVRGDLIRVLGNLMTRRDKFDYIMIETTGLAEPSPIAQTFFVDDDTKDNFALDGIVTVVDAKHVWQHIDSSKECQGQIAFADVILLNKVDLVPAEELDKLEAKIRAMNAMVRIHRTRNAEVDISKVLNVRAFDLESKLELKPDLLSKEELPFEWAGVYRFSSGAHELDFMPGPDPSINVLVLPVDGTDDASYDRVKRNATVLFSRKGAPVEPHGEIKPGNALHTLAFGPNGGGGTYILRVPGEGGTYAMFTQHLPSEFQMKVSQDGREVAPLRTTQYSHTHTHDQSVASVAIAMKGQVDFARLREWLGNLLRTRGVDIYRSKGILNVEGAENRLVFQGVHMLLDMNADRMWEKGEERKNQLVFIGRNLDRNEIVKGFSECLVQKAKK